MKITEDTKKNMNIFKRPFLVPSCLCVKNWLLIEIINFNALLKSQ